MSASESEKAKTDNLLLGSFISTPTNLHKTSAHSHYRSATSNLSNIQVLAISAQDVTTAPMLFDNDNSSSNSKKDKEKMKKKSLNYKLAYNPRMILLGLSTLLQISGVMTAYPTIAPLGRQTGKFYNYHECCLLFSYK